MMPAGALGPVPNSVVEAFWSDLLTMLRYVVSNPDTVCEEGDDCEPFNSVIRSVRWESDDAVAAIDTLTDWVLWSNPEDVAVREACVRLRAGRPGGGIDS